MAKPHQTWTVLPHGPIERLTERIWRVEARLPDVAMNRVMTVIRDDDGSLIVHNAIALTDDAMAELEGWGPIRMIIVPNGFHRLDAKPFAARYPDARVICPRGATAKVSQVVAVTGSYSDPPTGPSLELVTLDGTREREGVVIVREPDQTTLVFNDAVFNMPHLRGFTGFILRRITGSTGGPRVTRVAKWLVVSDKRAFRAHLERLANEPRLARIIVSHHQVIAERAAETLAEVAAAL